MIAARQMPFRDTLRPLVIASGVAAFIQLVVVTFVQQLPLAGASLLVLAMWIWSFSLAGAGVLVMPMMAVAARFRQPPWWVAAMWGALTAILTAAAVYAHLAIEQSLISWGWLCATGATAGICYSVLARRI